MWGRIITLLVALAEIARQILLARERKAARVEAKANEEELRKIEENPAGWFDEHFGVGPGTHRVREDDVPCPCPSTETNARDPPVDGGGRDVFESQ